MRKTRSETDINLFRAIEVFMAVTEMRQVTAAARALGMTQSAASQHLRNLETAFGVTLLNRAQRPISPTHAGEILQRHGFRILSEIEDLKSDLRHLTAAALPVLRIGMLASTATTLTPGLYDYVENDLRVPELILSAGLTSDHQGQLTSRKLDIVVTSDQFVTNDDYDVFPILEEPFLLVLPEGYDGPVDDIEAISSRLSLVRFGAETPVGRRTDQHLQRCRLDLPRSMEADRCAMIVAGVVTGKCFAILTPSLLIDGVAEGMPLRLAPLPFAGFKRGIQIVARRGDLGDIPLRLAGVCSDILQHHFRLRFPGFADQIEYRDVANP